MFIFTYFYISKSLHSWFFSVCVFHLKRIIMFHYNGPNCNNDRPACPDGLHLYYNYASDNNWSHDNVASIQDRTNSCKLRSNGMNRNVFIGLNNFVSPPSQSSAHIWYITLYLFVTSKVRHQHTTHALNTYKHTWLRIQTHGHSLQKL